MGNQRIIINFHSSSTARVISFFQKPLEANSLADIYEQGANLFNYHANESYATFGSITMVHLANRTSRSFHIITTKTTGKSIGLFGNYVLCYISVIALIITIYYRYKKDTTKLSIYILVAYLSLLLPYAFIQRPMFLYHYLPASVLRFLRF